MTIADFEQWSRQAIAWRNQTEAGTLADRIRTPAEKNKQAEDQVLKT